MIKKKIKSRRGEFNGIFNEIEHLYYIEETLQPNNEAKEKSIYEEDPIMWQVIFKKVPIPNYFQEKYEIIIIPNQPGKDKGHFIPKRLMDNLIPNYKKREEKIFTYKNNVYNITLQSEIANRGYKESKGQAQFEQKIANHFKDYDTDVYYEIEEIKNGDEILGRRLYIHFYDSQEDDIHVFIPEK